VLCIKVLHDALIRYMKIKKVAFNLVSATMKTYFYVHQIIILIDYPFKVNFPQT